MDAAPAPTHGAEKIAATDPDLANAPAHGESGEGVAALMNDQGCSESRITCDDEYKDIHVVRGSASVFRRFAQAQVFRFEPIEKFTRRAGALAFAFHRGSQLLGTGT